MIHPAGVASDVSPGDPPPSPRQLLCSGAGVEEDVFVLCRLTARSLRPHLPLDLYFWVILLMKSWGLWVSAAQGAPCHPFLLFFLAFKVWFVFLL